MPKAGRTISAMGWWLNIASAICEFVGFLLVVMEIRRRVAEVAAFENQPADVITLSAPSKHGGIAMPIFTGDGMTVQERLDRLEHMATQLPLQLSRAKRGAVDEATQRSAALVSRVTKTLRRDDERTRVFLVGSLRVDWRPWLGVAVLGFGLALQAVSVVVSRV